jgi:NAD(P)-dependent dehydrogenase (short-subunit alcohol dehydrogenase family)
LPELEVSELGTLDSLQKISERLQQTELVTKAVITPTGQATSAGSAASVCYSRNAYTQLHRLRLEVAPAPKPGQMIVGFGDNLVITSDETGIAEALLQRLGKRGIHASIVSEVPSDATTVIFLGGLKIVKNIQEAIAIEREVFTIANRIAKQFEKLGGLLVTVQNTGGDFGRSANYGSEISNAWLAGIAALARTASTEWPKASVKALDISRGQRTPQELAALIERELVNSGKLTHIGVTANGERLTLQAKEHPYQNSQIHPLQQTDFSTLSTATERPVWVITGGARGVTAECVIELARANRMHIALLGRTEWKEQEDRITHGVKGKSELMRALLDHARAVGKNLTPNELASLVAAVEANREIKSTLDAIRGLGSEANYFTVDVKDEQALIATFAAIRQQWGPINGIVHGAGVVADKFISEKSQTSFDTVFDTKVEGLKALLAASREDPLSSICLFSSISALVGNLGQCDYAMANEILYAVAQAESKRRNNGYCRVRSIYWGAWDGGMVTPVLRDRFHELGVDLISLKAGAEAFVEEILSPASSESGVVLHGGGNVVISFNTDYEFVKNFEIIPDPKRHSYLLDHCIDGTMVVPVALAVEWLAQAIHQLCPDLYFVGCKNLQVLRGIRLTRLGQESFRVRYRHYISDTTNRSRSEFLCELVGAGDAIYYRAIVQMGELDPSVAGLLYSHQMISGTENLTPWNQNEIYDGRVLFHGPRFQMIDSVEDLSKAGMTARLQGMNGLNWSTEAWRTDVVLFDGAMQLATLWARETLGIATLPMAVQSYRQNYHQLPNDPVQSLLRIQHSSAYGVRCDVDLVSSDGRLLASFEGIESFLVTSEEQAAS